MCNVSCLFYKNWIEFSLEFYCVEYILQYKTCIRTIERDKNLQEDTTFGMSKVAFHPPLIHISEVQCLARRTKIFGLYCVINLTDIVM